MSEHMAITGDVDFYHLPYDWEGGFAYCHRCKKVKNKLTIELHGGATAYWMQVICPTCKKTIWTSEFNNRLEKDDKKCAICKKSVNEFDCVSIVYEFNKNKGRPLYICSKKCYNAYEKKRKVKKK